MLHFIATVALAASALVTSTQANSAENSVGGYLTDITQGAISTNLNYADVMFDRQEFVTNKPLQQLKFRQQGGVKDKKMYLSGRFIGSYMYERTDTDGKFPILSRLPNQHTIGDENYEFVTNEASFMVTATPTRWMTLSVVGEYTEVEYPGQEEFQYRKYWALFGDLDKSPFYAAFGRNTVAFGNYSSYAPVTHNHSPHYFWAQTDDPHLELGYADNGWHLAASWLPSGRGLRVVNTPDEDGWENFALSARKDLLFSDDIKAEIGGGYLYSTIYDSTLAHHPPGFGAGDNTRNSAYNVHATLNYHDFDFNTEFTITEDQWPATDFRVAALTLQGRYNHDLIDMPAIASLMLSHGRQGSSATEWEKMDQIVTGYQLALHPNVRIGAEYLYNRGFVPLIMPKTTSDRGVDSHTFITALELTF